MKSFLPWICLMLAGETISTYAGSGIDAYRQGQYDKAYLKLTEEAKTDPMANYYLGRMYLYGYGQLKNDTSALRYFERAAEKGNLPAQRLLARFELIKENDPQKAFIWFKKAADSGDESAKLYCVAAYLYGFGVTKNTDKARQYFIDAAKMGNPIAQYTLAMHFLESKQLQNKKLGLIWLNKAVQLGNPRAMVQLAKLYQHSSLVSKDDEKAAELLVKASQLNSVPAMIALGKAALMKEDWQGAKDWYQKAMGLQSHAAVLELASLYLNPKSPFYQPKEGFLLTLKAAQENYRPAELALGQLYEQGVGVDKDAHLASLWLERSKKPVENGLPVAAKVASYLTNGKTLDLNKTPYHLKGILGDWHNIAAMRQQNYNIAPQMDKITRGQLFQPNFHWVMPNEVAINEYFDALAPMLKSNMTKGFDYPRYAINPQIEALLQKEVKPLDDVINDGQLYPSATVQPLSSNSSKVEPLNKRVAYQVLLEQLYNQAILGDTTSQFELGQLYEYGIGVKQDIQQAMTYYQLASAQGDVRSEYNLGLLYLEKKSGIDDVKSGVNWIIDAAFKGNANAQYVLAHLYETGVKDNDKTILSVDKEQSEAMYYLAASNQHALSQFQLADRLVGEKASDLSVSARLNHIQKIRSLYEAAANKGVAQAVLPLAFYNAMDSNTEKQKSAFSVARDAAMKGNTEAALLIGMMYDRGIGVDKNTDQALYWYKKASNNPLAAFILGTYYAAQGDKAAGRPLLELAEKEGFSWANINLAIMNKTEGKSFEPLLEQARQMSNSRAGLLLADFYLAKASDPLQMKKAGDIYREFATKGDKEAQLKLAYLYDTGLGGEKNFQQAAQWYQASAEQNNVMAQYLLGQMYQLGHMDNKVDYQQAKKWYRLAMNQYPSAAVALGFIEDTVFDNYQRAKVAYQVAGNQGSKTGQFNLAMIYENGKGEPIDLNKAMLFYQNAANSGSSDAMVKLASLAFNGQQHDVSQALSWYKKAAEKGNKDALYQLGLLSETGIAKKLDFKDALHYYEQAAAKGNEKAMLALARMYQYGLGVPRDINQAMKQYQLLAAQNNAYAQYRLASLYLDGSLGEKMPEQGRLLLQQASDNGSFPARKALQLLDAQSKNKVSYLEPLMMMKRSTITETDANLMYLEALNEWNRGDEGLSRLILDRLITQYPNFVPAKRTYEQLNQAMFHHNLG